MCTGGHKWVTNGSHCTVSVVAEEKATDSLPWRCSGKDADSGINEIKVKTSVFFPHTLIFSHCFSAKTVLAIVSGLHLARNEFSCAQWTLAACGPSPF